MGSEVDGREDETLQVYRGGFPTAWASKYEANASVGNGFYVELASRYLDFIFLCSRR